MPRVIYDKACLMAKKSEKEKARLKRLPFVIETETTVDVPVFMAREMPSECVVSDDTKLKNIPRRKVLTQEEINQRTQERNAIFAERYREAWKLIHSRPWTLTSYNGEVYWLKSVFDGLPCGVCRRHANSYLAKNPPDLSSQESYFRWTWEFHNDVNRRRGVAEMPYEEALGIYKPK